jgi:predicted AAA+ superfamily ATPase
MKEFNRIMELNLPPHQSAWLWGARKTGKSTFLRSTFPSSSYFDLLDSDLFLEYAKRPAVFREHVLALQEAQKQKVIVVDEVQKVPLLLDEVHYLIENHKLSFILCGSSARKLRHGHANLLGGRAWRYEMFPLSFIEIPNFNLLHALQWGLIPSHYLSPDPRRSMQSYVSDYLQLEVQQESLTRNLPAFSRFLDASAYSANQLVSHNHPQSGRLASIGAPSKGASCFSELRVLELPQRERTVTN